MAPRPLRSARLVLALLLAFICAAPAGAQEWFRQRTLDGRSIPITPDNSAAILGQPGLASVVITRPTSTTRFDATGLPLSIPDNTAAGITSTIAVPAQTAVSGIVVSLSITHSFPSDLLVTLTSPGGTVFTLSNHQGSGSALTLTDTALTIPSGFVAQGTWTLKVADTVAVDSGQLTSWSIGIRTPSSSALIDLTISLESNPTGDDNGNLQGQAGSAQQDKWERIVQHFADAVFEMTEGAHTVRQVRMFRSSANFGSADIRWSPKGHPHVPGGGGVGVAGGHVNMYETFAGGSGGSVDKDMLADEKGSGYTMAHEWGHFFLGVYDEYVNAGCATGNVMVSPSVMANQWQGKSDLKWLNFSVKRQGAGGAFQDSLLNCQHYAYGASAWEVLGRGLAADPTDQAHRGFQSLGPRIVYPELASVAPTAANIPRVDLPSASARGSLDIIWMKVKQNVEIVIDHSGSMDEIGASGSTKLADARTAAKLLVDQARLGQSRIGITIFDGSVSSILPLTSLDTEAVRTQVKAAIDGISSGGATAIGDAAASALAKLLALANSTGENKVVFLLTDGQNTTGVNPLSVIPNYASAHIPLFTLGFGSSVDSGVLSAMASGSGGRYFFSPTTLAQISAAFQAANQVASSSPGLGTGSLSPTAAAAATTSVPVDASLDRLQLSVVMPTTVAASAIVLTSPTGTIVTPASTSATANERLVFFDVDRPAAGNWQLRVDPSAAGKTVSYSISGSQASVGYDVSTGLRGGSTVVGAPGPVIIESKLSRRQPIAAASVTAVVTSPAAQNSTVPLFDDGIYPDLVARDGTYTGTYIHSGQGDYTISIQFSNPTGSATETYGGANLTPDETGSIGAPPADAPIAERFARSQTTQFTVQTATAALAPLVIGEPSDQAVAAGASAAFAVAVTAAPAPTYQWQRQAAGTSTFSSLSESATFVGVAAATLTVANAPRAMSGDKFRSVITNSAGTATSAVATLTVTGPALPTMALSTTSLSFGAVTAGGAFSSQTSAQAVRLSQAGTGVVTWTVSSSQPWLSVSPASGSGSANLVVTVAPNASLPVAGDQSGAVTVTLTGAANSVAPVTVSLKLLQNGTSQAPLGVVDTPINGSTGVTGSIGVTGWAVDDVEVRSIRVYRDSVAGETPGVQVFIGNAVAVEGARPDVVAQYPALPKNTAAGWGYLLLTNMLPGGGNSSFTLYMYADDADGHSTLLGSRTFTAANASATLPFGAIDTPGQGEIVSGSVNNFGWVLSPGTRRADPPGGGAVVVLVDGTVVGSPAGWNARTDLTALFPAASHAGIGNALGVLGINTTGLANGVHTLAWVVTDNTGGAAGIGSRYFTVANGSLMLEPSTSMASAPALTIARLGDVPSSTAHVTGRRGFSIDAPVRAFAAQGGRVTVQSEEMDRIELHLEGIEGSREGVEGARAGVEGARRQGAGTYAGYLRVGNGLAPLPVGSSLNPETGEFTWQPGVGFIGPYDLVFVRWSGGRAIAKNEVRIVLNAKGSNRIGPQVVIDLPAEAGRFGEDVASAFRRKEIIVAGWAADLDAATGTGVETVHVWAYPLVAGADRTGGAQRHGAPMFVGAATYGTARPDVAAVYGARFANSGYGIRVEGLEPGDYDIAVFAYSSVARGFLPAKTVRVTVR